MGLGTAEQSSTSSIPGMSGSAARMQQLMAQAAEMAAGQLDPSQVSTSATPEQRQAIQQAQESTGDIARSQMEAMMEDMMSQTQADALNRGIEGSSIEQVNQAVAGRDVMRQMNEMIMGQQAQSANQLVNAGFANAQVDLSRNQQLLEMLLGSAPSVMQGNLNERLAQGSTQTTSEQSPFNALLNMGMQGAGLLASGGASAAVPAAQKIAQ